MTRKKALAELRALFERNGYARSEPDRRRFKTTHRGYELRWAANDAEERDRIVGLLRRAGFRPGRPFAKVHQFRVPVYGAGQVRELTGRLGI